MTLIEQQALDGVRFERFRREPRPLSVAVVGYGYWGPNLVRNVMERPELELVALCELDEARAAACLTRYPTVRLEPQLDRLLADPAVDAVVVATPPRTHHRIVKAVLSAGKHVLVEKPLATTAEDARELVGLAGEQGLVCMPGHTFVYSPPVNKVKQLIDDGELGEVYFVTSSRMNLGKYQADGVITDLAPHDLSILLYWLERPVSAVSATARSVFQSHICETAFLNLTFDGGTAANVQISWMAPSKVRQMVVVGSKRMVQYDDTAADEAIRIYDRGLEFSAPETFGEHQLSYRSGDVVVPRLEPAEPLALELEDFANAVRTGKRPRSHAQLGLEVVEAMAAAEKSLRLGGAPISLGSDELAVA